MLRFFAPVAPAGGRIEGPPDKAVAGAQRGAPAAPTPHATLMAWPWHRTLAVWAEAEALHEETWGMLLKVWYTRRD